MYNNIVVSEAYSDVRAMARNVMRRKWFMSALALLIYTFIVTTKVTKIKKLPSLNRRRKQDSKKNVQNR